ncbi:MAG: histidinol dehydrogenase [Solirubrobacteraceae bacterium]
MLRLERLELDAAAPGLTAARIRQLAPACADVREAVAAILAEVAARGDAALQEYTERFDQGGHELRVTDADLAEAAAALDPAVRSGLQSAIANVAEVAWAGVHEDREVVLAQGQHVSIRELPVRRAAVYAPGGRAPYPSTVVMGVVCARAAGVEQVVVCSPPAVDPVLLAACEICGVKEVYRMGGAQAVAALALGTSSVERVDVIVGPGNLYVQEAKRQLSDRVGIDGFAGPSDLLVLFDAADEGSLRLIALDLLAQAEHGPESLVLATAADAALLDALDDELRQLAPLRPSAQPAACVLVQAPSLEAALEFSDVYAPEHLQLIGPQAEALAPRVRSAGCVFVGWPAATAFGDYIAGSNHVLPTGGSARFASALGPGHFRRRMAEVRIPASAAQALAEVGAPIAAAEGFRVHAESMRARVRGELRENPSK